MRIKITKPGIFGAGGEIAVGTEIDVPNWPDKKDNGDPNPHPWAGRFEVLSHASPQHVPVNNDQPKTVAELLALDGDPNPHPWAGRFEVLSHASPQHVPVNNDQPKTVAELLALAEDSTVHHTTFKAEAKKALGDKIKEDAKKADILAVLFDAATDTELKTYLVANGVTVTDETRADLVKLALAA